MLKAQRIIKESVEQVSSIQGRLGSFMRYTLESARDTNLAERFTMLREEKRQTRALLAKSASALPRDSKEAEEATAPR